MKRRFVYVRAGLRGRVLVAIVAVALVAVTAWRLLDLPPPGLLIEYGVPPGAAPTGRRHTDRNGYEFVEIGRGAVHVRRRIYESRGDFLGRICGVIGFELGEPRVTSTFYREDWIQVEEPYHIQALPTTGSKLWQTVAAPAWRTREEVEALRRKNQGHWPLSLGAECCRVLTRRLPGNYRLPTQHELLAASALGLLEESDLDYALAPDPRGGSDLLVPVGTKWENSDCLQDDLFGGDNIYRLRPGWRASRPRTRFVHLVWTPDPGE